MKCKQKREMKNEQETATSKGVRMMKGQCSVCGTNLCKIIGKQG